MSECMCDTVLHECHTENWVWLVLQAKVSCSLFSNQPIGRGKNKQTTVLAAAAAAAAVLWDPSAGVLASLS